MHEQTTHGTFWSKKGKYGWRSRYVNNQELIGSIIERSCLIVRCPGIAPKPPLPFLKFLRSSTKPFWAEGSLFSLQEDTGLQGNQDSRVGSISALAQLAWQPFFYMADRASHECHTES
ncbi:hypothetical protein BDBG_17079 [Blastomyces gilchristii SLH14081]|uniref:Uncharacterized protein n=1 Tax=Blastomyces gilchristii (strain SLH14081) TaxID=559298 RepID=A0A179UN05_BLAGS|nr:uncharacterized protein BDBG_17079 [Blastomyces gilchristii SLH14081]OAT08599.1 hypothetical protein BDBG_17079 [Blastomyces gilchristii SLH14081]